MTDRLDLHEHDKVLAWEVSQMFAERPDDQQAEIRRGIDQFPARIRALALLSFGLLLCLFDRGAIIPVLAAVLLIPVTVSLVTHCRLLRLFRLAGIAGHVPSPRPVLPLSHRDTAEVSHAG